VEEDIMKTEQKVNTNDTGARISSLVGKIGRILFWWSPASLVFGIIVQAAGGQWGHSLSYLGSPVLAAIMIVIAVRHYPASRRFLKWFVAITLVATILFGGFFQCASLASRGKLVSTMEHTYTNYSNAEPPISTSRVVLTTYMDMVFEPLFPISDAYFYPSVRGVFLAVYYFASKILYAYTPMLGPYYLLILLVTPSFLALPIFWLWVVLSILYVVLPARAWKWVRGGIAKARLMLRRSRTPQQ